MDTDIIIKDGIIRRAERLLHYNNLLIEQCDSWLPENPIGGETKKKKHRQKLTIYH